MYTSDVSLPNFSQIGVGSDEIWFFFIFFILQKNLNAIFSKVHFSKFALRSTDFDELYRISTCILQTSHSQIGVGSAEIWIFSSLYPPKTLNRIFSKIHFFKFTLYMFVFRFNWAICLVFFWNMLIWVPTTQFCGKLKNSFLWLR